MKRAVPILLFILILIFRQAPSAIIVGQGQKGYSNLQEANSLFSTQGLGWFEEIEKNDPGVLPPVFQAFQNEGQDFIGKALLRSFKYVCHFHSNPLLIDRPPPALEA